MTKTILKPIDILTELAFEGLKQETNSYGEPRTYVDVLKYDDENETMVSIRFTEEREGLKKSEYYYTAEIVITDDVDLVDDDMVLTSHGIGKDYIRELIESVSKTDFSQYCK